MLDKVLQHNLLTIIHHVSCVYSYDASMKSGRSAYDEDDEEAGHPRGMQCQTH